MKPKRDIFWTPDMAYLVGLITTDGCLSPDQRHLTFTSIDLDLIETFKTILKINNRVGKTTNSRSWAYRLQFSDVQLYRWLIAMGLTPKKSKTLGPIAVPPEYFRDFLRGHLDGDGSITKYTDTTNSHKNPAYVYERLSMRFISASEQHVKWLHGRIKYDLGITGRLHAAKRNPKTGTSIHIVKFGKKASINLLKILYYSKDLPSLTRKRLIANEVLSSRPSKRKQYVLSV